MRHQFTVDLRGIVDLLSHHLYSSERVYLRELLQNAHDAIRTRAELDGPDYIGRIEIEPAVGYRQLVVRDNGIGLTAADMHALLSMIGSTSKQGDLVASRDELLGQFGIGLLSCFLVADSIEVVSRSARVPDAPTVRWVGLGDGTFTIGDALEPLAQPGTEVRLKPQHGSHRWCNSDACLTFATEFAEFLDVAVLVEGTPVSQQQPPWELTTGQQLDWCRERFGFDALGIVPIDIVSPGVVGLAFVLPYTARPGYRTGDRIYAKGMLVADTDDLVVPRWAFFCRAVIDAGGLPLTASREALQESAALQLARKQIGFRLLSELIIVQGMDPEIYDDVIRLHADGLKALAVQEPDVRSLLRSTLRYETTRGELTIDQMLEHPGPVPYVTDPDAYQALHDLAARAGATVVNAGGLHEAELLQVINRSEPGHFREAQTRDVADLVPLTPYPDGDQAALLVARAHRALRGEALAVRVEQFEPVERPVLWWPGETGDRPGPATLVLNAANNAVKRLLGAPEDTDLAPVLHALFVAGLLDGRMQPTVEQVGRLRTALLYLIEESALAESPSATGRPGWAGPAGVRDDQP
jgi:molecular chaperone HtpG